MCWRCRELDEYRAELDDLLADVDVDPFDDGDELFDWVCEDERPSHDDDTILAESFGAQEAFEEALRERRSGW